MGTVPNYTNTPHNAAAITSATQQTSLTPAPGAAGVVTVFTAGANGSKIDWIRINQLLTTTASGVVNLFITDGTTMFLHEFMQYSAVTLSTTFDNISLDLYYDRFILQSGWSLRVTNTVQSSAGPTAANFVVLAFGGDA